jgi:hypothetical protein
MKNFAGIGAMGMLLLSFLPQSAPQTRGPLPKVVSASVPFYPRLAPAARIQGTVRLHLSTDGKRVSAIDGESGPPMLVLAAKENVKTWQFEPHTPTNFEVVFRYRLLTYMCDSQCRCESTEKESVLLQLPASVEISATLPMICDPAAQTDDGKRPGRVEPRDQAPVE